MTLLCGLFRSLLARPLSSLRPADGKDFHRWRYWFVCCVVLIALLTALGCSPTESESGGGEVSQARIRILSLSPGVSELLVEFGAGTQIVAADSVSRERAGLELAVDLGELGLENVNDALASTPDLVVGLATPQASAFAAALGGHGIVVHLFDPRDADAVIRVVHRLGDLLERPERAIAVAADRIRAVSELAGLRDGKSRLTAVWLIGCDPLTVIGGSGMAHEVLELAGAENGFHLLGKERVEITREQLAAQVPEVVLDSTGRDASQRCFDYAPHAPRIETTPRSLASLPGLDLRRRVRAVHAILYSDRVVQ